MNPRSDAFLAAMREEFPTFSIEYKRNDRLQRAIHVALLIVTLGGQNVYITRYYTALFGKLWVPDSWDQLGDDDRYVLLRHEVIHLRQRRRMGEIPMAIYYLLWLFPIGLAWGRARIEWEAYLETIRATHEVFGMDAAKALRTEILRRYTGPDYGWMWPFPAQVNAWFDAEIAALEKRS